MVFYYHDGTKGNTVPLLIFKHFAVFFPHRTLFMSTLFPIHPLWWDALDWLVRDIPEKRGFTLLGQPIFLLCQSSHFQSQAIQADISHHGNYRRRYTGTLVNSHLFGLVSSTPRNATTVFHYSEEKIPLFCILFPRRLALSDITHWNDMLPRWHRFIHQKEHCIDPHCPWVGFTSHLKFQLFRLLMNLWRSFLESRLPFRTLTWKDLAALLPRLKQSLNFGFLPTV